MTGDVGLKGQPGDIGPRGDKAQSYVTIIHAKCTSYIQYTYKVTVAQQREC